MQEAPWAKSISPELFLNDVLPYASLNEQRDNWRQRLHEICLPLVKDCKTPAEAAQTLNQQTLQAAQGEVLDGSAGRRTRAPSKRWRRAWRPAPGCPSCSWMPVAPSACRRASWARRSGAINSGNHTWVEIWDGDWHFTGAAEPDPNGLDRGWFVGNASQAVKDDRDHAIYASSFKKTGLSFPLSGPGGRTTSARSTSPTATPPRPSRRTPSGLTTGASTCSTARWANASPPGSR